MVDCLDVRGKLERKLEVGRMPLRFERMHGVRWIH